MGTWVRWARNELRILFDCLKLLPSAITTQKMKFFIKDFFSKCDQICRKLAEV